MINPDDMPANKQPEPDRHEPGLRIMQCVRESALDKITPGISQLLMVNQLVQEVMREVPDADLIEVRAIKYPWSPTEEGTDERSVSDPPAGQ